MRYITTLAALALAGVCSAQTPQSPATPNDLRYLRFILLDIAGLDHGPGVVQAFEDLLSKQFALSRQESAVIHAHGQALKPLLAEHRQTASAIVAGKSALSQADAAALKELDTEREQKIIDLANQVLATVNPATAARLRAAGNRVPTAAKKKP